MLNPHSAHARALGNYYTLVLLQMRMSVSLVANSMLMTLLLTRQRELVVTTIMEGDITFGMPDLLESQEKILSLYATTANQ